MKSNVLVLLISMDELLSWVCVTALDLVAVADVLNIPAIEIPPPTETEVVVVSEKVLPSEELVPSAVLEL